MTTSTQWQLARESAERYQSILTPAILGPFARALVDVAAVQHNEWVVDVGCGTGAAARYAAKAERTPTRVTGVDVSEAMIDVAQSLPDVPGAPIEWRQANATQLPLDTQSVDVTLCAQTLQFIPEKLSSLREMGRVLKPGGRLALSLWCAIEESPYFSVLVDVVATHIGTETAAGLNAAFALSDADDIHALLAEAGFEQIEIATSQLDLPLPKLTEFVPRHITATPMAAGFSGASESIQRAVIQEVSERLSAYEGDDHARVPFSSYMITGRNGQKMN